MHALKVQHSNFCSPLQDFTEDVTQIAQKYINSLADKDADLFALYEEKLHLQTVVESLNNERKQLSDDLSTTVDTLQRLEGGAKALQDSFLQLQSSLSHIVTEVCKMESLCGVSSLAQSVSSERDHSSGMTLFNATEVTEISIAIHRCFEFMETVYRDNAVLRSELKARKNFEEENFQFAVDQLMDAEHKERHSLCEGAFSLLPLYFSFAHQQAQRTKRSLELEEELGVMLSLHVDENKMLEERQSLALAHKSREIKRLKESKKELQKGLEKNEQERTERSQQQLMDLAIRELYINSLEIKVQVLQTRCAVAEAQWRHSGRAFTKQLVAKESQRKKQELENGKKTRALKSTISKQSEVMEKQAKLSSSFGEKMKSSTAKMVNLSNDCDQLKQKHQQLLQDTKRERQKSEAIMNNQKKRIDELENSLTTLQRQCDSCQQGQAQLQLENTTLRERVSFFSSMAEKLQSAAAKAEAVPMLKRQADDRITLLTQKFSTEREDLIGQIEAAAERIQLLEKEKSRSLSTIEKVREQWNQERQRREREASLAKVEIQKVKQMMDSLCMEQEGYVRQLEMERRARDIFEQQQQMESNVVKQLMEKADRAQREIAGAELLQSECDRLRHKVSVLEDACRKSAHVIAELRENVFSERQLSSQLLSSLSSPPSKVGVDLAQKERSS